VNGIQNLGLTVGEVLTLGAVLMSGGIMIGNFRGLRRAFDDHVEDARSRFAAADSKSEAITVQLQATREEVAGLQGKL